MTPAALARLAGLAWLLAAPLGAPAAGAAETAQPAPAAHIARELPRARLAGQGGYSWFGLKIYHAQLWVGEQGYRGGAPEAAPFVLDLRYQRALDGAKIAAASAEQMRKIDAGSEVQRQAWLRTMERVFPDVQEGTHISGAYLPGAGARFYLDGKLLAEVPDAAFARAFFAIWLDPASSAGKLREALLLDAAPRL